MAVMIYTRFEDIGRLQYDLIMADPPWNFRTYSARGNAKSASSKYECMSIDEIKAMRVCDLASHDCVLWLWATNPMLPQALDVLSAWGFAFKSAGHWVKRTRHGKLAFGTGYVLRSAGEPFLIGTIGRPKFARNVRSVIDARAREHSRKPDEAYAAADRLVPNAVRRLDLFGRETRRGWDVFGNEPTKFYGE